MREKLPIILLSFVIALTLSACAKLDNTKGITSPSPSASTSAAVPTNAANDAATIFKQNCIACHGAELQGTMIGPNLQAVGARLNIDKIINQITNGDTMPPFIDKLNKEEIESLARWLSSKK